MLKKINILCFHRNRFFSSVQKALMKINALHSLSTVFLISMKSADEK